jgi:hypothetical protein
MSITTLMLLASNFIKGNFSPWKEKRPEKSRSGHQLGPKADRRRPG